MFGIGSTGDLETNENFVEKYGITFTMLWSASRLPTSYYHTYTGTWSGFWLLDRTGKRIVAGHYSDALVEFLLVGLE